MGLLTFTPYKLNSMQIFPNFPFNLFYREQF